MDTSRKTQAAPNTLLRRLLVNAAWLIGGKGFGAVCSLIYLAILTRSLGLKDFGHFALIFGTAQALVAVAGFQTWQTVVRFGVSHVHAKDWDSFGRLSMIALILDIVGALLGSIIAYVVFYQFAEFLDLNPLLVDTAFWFNFAALWALVSAPTGIVRALDRFDIAVYVEAFVPLARLVAAVAIALTGPSLVLFLIAWAVIDLIEALIYWVAARMLCPKAIKLRYLKQIWHARSDNPGLIKFSLVVYGNSTLEALFRHGPLLAVGYFVGTSAAGVYRLAHQLAQGLTKLSSLLSRAAYAEISRARVVSAADEFRQLAAQTSKIATTGGVLVVTVAMTVGGHILALLGGEAFRGGYMILLPLTIAASIELASIAFEPVLHSTGRAQYTLLARLVMVITVGAMLLTLIGEYHGPGAAWSVAIAATVGYVMMASTALAALRAVKAKP